MFGSSFEDLNFESEISIYIIDLLGENERTTMNAINKLFIFIRLTSTILLNNIKRKHRLNDYGFNRLFLNWFDSNLPFLWYKHIQRYLLKHFYQKNLHWYFQKEKDMRAWISIADMAVHKWHPTFKERIRKSPDLHLRHTWLKIASHYYQKSVRGLMILWH